MRSRIRECVHQFNLPGNPSVHEYVKAADALSQLFATETAGLGGKNADGWHFFAELLVVMTEDLADMFFKSFAAGLRDGFISGTKQGVATAIKIPPEGCFSAAI